VLADRESELATLRAQAALLDASRESGAGDEAKALSSALARAELAARVAGERAAMLESQLAMAQERLAMGECSCTCCGVAVWPPISSMCSIHGHLLVLYRPLVHAPGGMSCHCILQHHLI
jgi:hypothetical protein